MKIFDPSKPLYHKIIIISAIITTTLVVAAFVMDIFWGTKLIINNSKYPNLVVIGEPRNNIGFEFNYPVFEFTIEKKDLHIVDTTYQESPVFKLEEKNELYIKLEPLKKINIDSITNNSKNTLNVGTVRIYPELTLKNVGDNTAKIIALACTDTLSTNNIIRNLLLYEPEQGIKGYLDENQVSEILPDTTTKIKLGYHIPIFFDEQNNFYLHLYILYKDIDNNIYETYYIAKYKAKKLYVNTVIQPVYIKENNKIILKQFIIHYIPKKPKFDDLFELILTKPYYEYKFTDEEKKILIKNYGEEFKL